MDIASLRIFMLPDSSRLNPYISNWLYATGIRPATKMDRSEYKKTILNSWWIKNNIQESDVVHFHWKFDHEKVLPTILAFFALKQRKAKILWTIHEILPQDESNLLKSIFIKWFLFMLADRIIVHNHNLERMLQRYFGRCKSIVYIEHPDYEMNLIPKNRAKAMINESRIMFLCFGNMKSYKDFQKAIDAFPSEASNLVLWIVGEMPKIKPATLSLFKNGVVIRTGPLTVNELEVIVGAADICVLPYKWCAASGALTYLKQYGKPLIVSDAACLQADEYLCGILRFKTTIGLRNAMISSISMIRENNNHLNRNVDNEQYRAKAASVYSF